MKTKPLFLLFAIITFWSCSENKDVVLQPVSVNINFNHSWNGTGVTSADFNDHKFVNENGETISISRLRYVVSDFLLTHESGVETVIEGHNLVDVTNDENLTFTTPANILPGEYTLTFRFGFSDEDNIDGAYQDLNTAVFNVSAMLGGGYHYMQFDGTYLDASNAEMPFNYHAIRAFDTTGTNDPQDTSIQINLGAVTISSITNVNVDVDLYQWFSSPNLWDLNVLNTVLMPNYDAQLMMSQNGATVFSLTDVTQE